MNQKKAVDVLSKWPPKDRGTSRNPVVDVDFSSSQVLRQQRLSRLLHPRWKEPGQGPEAFWANSDGYTETWGRKI